MTRIHLPLVHVLAMLSALFAVATGADDSQPGPTAIARWDVAPFQTFTDRFAVGVVAFHIDGIDRVEFVVNGRAPVCVRELTFNPSTSVEEYWFELDAKDYPDGPVVVEAAVYPLRGRERTLRGDSTSDKAQIGEFALHLSANARGTLPTHAVYVSPSGSDELGDGIRERPFASIRRAARAIQAACATNSVDGGVIYLLEGDYRPGMDDCKETFVSTTRWLSIESAPGVQQDQVRIVATGCAGLRTRLLRIAGVTILGPETGVAIGTAGPQEDYLWLDRCRLIGAGRTTHGRWYGGWTKSFATGLEISHCANGLGAELQRDVLVHSIGSDAFPSKGLIVNCVARNIDPRDTKFHADVVQYYPSAENAIVYGLTAIEDIRAQGLFAGKAVPLRDVAFVNCRINNQTLPSHPMRVMQFGGPTQHLYIKGCFLTGPANWRTDFGFSATDVVVEETTRGKILPFFAQPRHVEGVIYRSR